MKNEPLLGGVGFPAVFPWPQKWFRECGTMWVLKGGVFRLAAHMLGYAGKTLVWREIGEKVPFALSFQ